LDGKPRAGGTLLHKRLFGRLQRAIKDILQR